jgi:hypothetical protein
MARPIPREAPVIRMTRRFSFTLGSSFYSIDTGYWLFERLLFFAVIKRGVIEFPIPVLVFIQYQVSGIGIPTP